MCERKGCSTWNQIETRVTEEKVERWRKEWRSESLLGRDLT